jgi:hypothetical protein
MAQFGFEYALHGMKSVVLLCPRIPPGLRLNDSLTTPLSLPPEFCANPASQLRGAQGA